MKFQKVQDLPFVKLQHAVKKIIEISTSSDPEQKKQIALYDQTQINSCKFVFVTVMPMRFLIAIVIACSYALYWLNDRRCEAAVHRGIQKFLDDPDDVLKRIQDAQ